MPDELKTNANEARQKGQSAIEYLMTYGWALVVIVVTIAALVFLVNPQQLMAAGCTGFSQLPIKTQYLSGTATGATYTIKFTNMTGQNLTSTIMKLTGDMNETNTTMGTITSNQTKTFVATLGADDSMTNKASKAAYSVDLNLTYTDADNFVRSVQATCKGTAP